MNRLAPIKSANLAMLIHVSEKLGDLRDDVVFLGGCATALLISDPATPDVRHTLDVDCIVDVISRQQYHEIEAKLRKLGFSQSMQEKVICRWHTGEMILDIMPTDESILGFSNFWYKAAIEHKAQASLRKDIDIYVVTAPYFLATKLEAFKGRGNGDYLASHDLEDIITVLDGRPEIVKEVEACDIKLKNYLQHEFQVLIQNKSFLDALPGHLNYGSILSDRLKIVWKRIQKIAGAENAT